jgi:prepilin-type processing-associated H-X9-DG protein
MTRATSRRPAFTLLELLVGLGIVVLLTALLLGVAKEVRASAAKAACANNLRQIGGGLVAYAQEFGRLPGSEGHKTLSDLPSFVDVLVKRQHYPPAAFICPSSDLDRPSSYEMNFDYVGQPFSKGSARTVLAYEGGSCGQCHEGSKQLVGHGQTANHLFFDGHVEALPKPKPASPRTPTAPGSVPPRPPRRG